MEREYIHLENLREHNLKGVCLDIPKRAITVFTGVSGSGKSSLVFDTLGAEAQRQLGETYSAYVQNRLPKFPRPKAGVISHLSPAIVVGQSRLGGSSRSTVGTATDLQPLLRLLFSRVGRPRAGSAGSFSFNDPEGACPDCNGLGVKTALREELLLDFDRSLNKGAILFPVFPAGSWYWKTYVLSGLFDCDKPLRDYTPEELQTLLHGKPGAKVELPSKSGPFVFDYEGLVEKITRLFILRKQENLSQRVKEQIAPFLRSGPCPTCHGDRYCQRVLACKIDGRNLADWCRMEVDELLPLVRSLTGEVEAPIAAAIAEKLQQLQDVGLGYLNLGRETATLSGGESQRVKMVRHLGSTLSDLLYIFDEPSIGLHPRDLPFLGRLFAGLRDRGNTVLVVEHSREVMAMADWAVDIGPGAGEQGGEVVYQGPPNGLAGCESATGRALCRPLRLAQPRPLGEWLPLEAGQENNLTGFSTAFPKGAVTALCGPAGSGKSTLARAFCRQYPEAVLIDQGGIGASPRSTPATYTKLFDEIRTLFAAANGVPAARFSFNSKGACPDCKGAGYVYTDLAFLEPVRTTCKTCQGRRFGEEVLAYTLRGKNIAQVLELSVEEALDFFTEPKVVRSLRLLQEVGLGYLSLGQPVSTLSGGECQRLKLAAQLRKKSPLYLFDEPTAGLHISEVERLLAIFRRLTGQGSTVLVIEHDLQVVAQADWVLELGPGSGRRGGELVFAGTPAQLAEEKTATGLCLGQALL